MVTPFILPDAIALKQIIYHLKQRSDSIFGHQRFAGLYVAK